MAQIFTSKGMIDEALLSKKSVVVERAGGVENAEEWWFNGELVKRNASFTPRHRGPRAGLFQRIRAWMKGVMQ